MRPMDATADGSDLTAEHERVLEKVRALLAKAESTTFPHEAEAFTAKAQELLSRYRLDEALATAEGRSTVGGAGRHELLIEQPYATGKFVLLSGIARANHCAAVFNSGRGVGTLVGFPSDVEAVVVLYTSLLLQGTSELLAEGSVRDAAGRSRTRSFRHAFWLAFGSRIGQRLEEATRVAEADLVDDAVAGAALPVLVRRDEVVQEVVDAEFGRLRRLRTSISSPDGARAGTAAANRARLGGQERLPGP